MSHIELVAMMETRQITDAELPTFNSPPVEEVSLGIQFTCQEIAAVHLGSFYEAVKKRFPRYQQVPAIPPQFETFVGPAQPQAMMMVPVVMPPFQRQWFISDEDDQLIQLQPDRLLVNWRRRPEAAPYPRYGKVRDLFTLALDVLDTWMRSAVKTEYAVNQCEITYFNVIPLADQSDWGKPGKWIALWKDELDGGEGVSFSTRHILAQDGEPFARLTTDVFGGQRDENHHLVVNLTARGRPLGSGREGVLAFMDEGREAIVKRFDAITTPEAHALWGGEA